MKPHCRHCGHSFLAHQFHGNGFVLQRCNASDCWCDGYEPAGIRIPVDDRQLEYAFLNQVFGPEKRIMN